MSQRTENEKRKFYPGTTITYDSLSVYYIYSHLLAKVWMVVITKTLVVVVVIS